MSSNHQNYNNSIEESHTTYINELLNNNETIENKKQQLNILYNSLDNLKPDNNYLKNRLSILKNITILKNHIYNLENSIDLSDYYSKIGLTITEYYTNNSDSINNNIIDLHDIHNKDNNDDLIEFTLKQFKNNNKQKKQPKKRLQQTVQTHKSILDYFNPEDITYDTKYHNNTIDKISLNNNYLTLLNKSQFSDLINKHNMYICSHCNIEKIFHNDGYYICPKCGESEHIYIENELLNIKDSSNNKQKYPYRRLNHFKEKLAQFQGKENFDIPDYVKQTIYNQIYINGIDKKNITRELINKILHEFKYSSCYEHLTFIYKEITKKNFINIDKSIEDKLCSLFTQMQNAHNKHSPQTRLNSINYFYIINKLLKILNEHELADNFPLLKNKEKLRNLDKIWENICDDMGWVFYSSF